MPLENPKKSTFHPLFVTMKSFSIVLFLFFVCSVCFSQSNVLQLHPENPHYFLYKNKPLLIVSSAEHYGSAINKAFDYKKYFETLSKDGLNYTRLFAGSYIEKVGDFGIQRNTLAAAADNLLLPWKRSAAEGFFLGGNKFDLSQWDAEYFDRLKSIVSSAREKDIIVEITLFSSYYGNGWKYSPFNSANNINETDNTMATLINTTYNGGIIKDQEKYVRKMVSELNEFGNIYFEIQNEPWADQLDTAFVKNEYDLDKKWTSSIQVVSQISLDWQRKVSSWIKDEEKALKNKHLISQNVSNFHYPVANPDPNVSIFNFHYAIAESVNENYYLNKPIGFNETGFAGKHDITYRRQAWRFVMAGGSLFNHLDYSFSVGKENGSDTTYKSPGGGSVALRAQLGVIKKTFDKLDLIHLHPDKIVIKASPSYHSMALGNGKNIWVIYLESMGTKPNELLFNLPSGKYEAEWVDVKTGTLISNTTMDGTSIKVPSGNNDKLLIVRSKKG